MTTELKTGVEQMKSKKLSLLILLFVFVLVFFLGALFFHYVNPVVKQNQLHSDLLFLDNVTRTCIAEYYKKNIEYPKDLTEIENSIIENMLCLYTFGISNTLVLTSNTPESAIILLRVLFQILYFS